MHCSLTERRADDATRDVENWLKCYFMQDKVGETFDGTISGVTSFGIFVTLDDLNIDGLVHVTELGRDYFHFDPARHAMIGERSGRSFQLAGRVRVKVARVDLETDEDRLHAGRGRRRRRAPARPAYGEPLARAGRAGQAQAAALAPDGRRPRGAGEPPTSAGTDLVVQAPAHRRRRARGDRRARGRAAASRRSTAARQQAYRLPRVGDARRRRRVLRAAGIDSAFVPADLARDRVRAGRDGHGLDADHDRVHRRDRRHAGHQAAGGGDHRGRDARRDRLRARASRAASRCSPGCRSRALAARLRRAAAALAGRRADARGLRGGRREDAARLRRLHVLHRPAAGAPRARRRRRRTCWRSSTAG